jgi:ElaB/YqjD/DUF883 family membrane-anchored ribosome-binding protein
MMRQETERLRQQMHKVMHEFDRLAGQVADRGGESAAEASKRIGHGVEDARIGLLDLGDEVALQGRRVGRHLQRSVSRHPWWTVGAALAVAAAVALVTARRRRA